MGPDSQTLDLTHNVLNLDRFQPEREQHHWRQQYAVAPNNSTAFRVMGTGREKGLPEIHSDG